MSNQNCVTSIDGMQHCDPCEYCGINPATIDGVICVTCDEYHSDNPAGPTLMRDESGTVIEKDSAEYNFYINQL